MKRNTCRPHTNTSHVPLAAKTLFLTMVKIQRSSFMTHLLRIKPHVPWTCTKRQLLRPSRNLFLSITSCQLRLLTCSPLGLLEFVLLLAECFDENYNHLLVLFVNLFKNGCKPRSSMMTLTLQLERNAKFLVVKLGTSPPSAARCFPAVKLMTITQALLGGTPEYQKKKSLFSKLEE